MTYRLNGEDYSQFDAEYVQIFNAVSPLVTTSAYRTGFACLRDDSLDEYYDLRQEHLDLASNDRERTERRNQWIAYSALVLAEVRSIQNVSAADFLD